MTPQQAQRIRDNEYKRKLHRKENLDTFWGASFLFFFACFVCIILSLLQQ